MERIGIEFGGGKESIKLVKELKKYNPIVFFCAHKGAEGVIPLVKRWAELEGVKLVIVRSKSESYNQKLSGREITRDDGRKVFLIDHYYSPCLRAAKRHGITVLYNGRRQVDYPHLKDVVLPEKLYWHGIEIRFPYWHVQRLRE